MSIIKVNSASELIQVLRDSAVYNKHFKEELLLDKVAREEKVWRLLSEQRGKYNKEILNEIFDTVDTWGNTGKRWFGALLAMPNRNLLFESTNETINNWINVLLFSDKELSERLLLTKSTYKIKGASKGLISLLLYLSDPGKYNVWINPTESGLRKMGFIEELSSTDFVRSFDIFNASAIKFRQTYEFNPHEIDWVLSFLSKTVSKQDNFFMIDGDILSMEKRRYQQPVIEDDANDEKEKVRSWSREAGVEGLIGRKKVDWSTFEYGTHIPIQFHEYFAKANGGVQLARGERHDAQLIIDGAKYTAQLYNIDRKGLDVDTLQIRYDNNTDLKEILIKKFVRSYSYLKDIRLKTKEVTKKHVVIPDENAEFMEFYETEIPFSYRVENIPAKDIETDIKRSNAIVWWVNQGATLNEEKEEGILWAPIKSSDGKTLYHWKTMTEVQEGDIILHYANGALRYVSEVIEPAIETKKPISLKSQSWDEDGRLVKAKYYKLKPDIPLVKFSKDVMALNIDKGPLDVNGSVKQGYLFRLNIDALQIIQKSQPETEWPEFTQFVEKSVNYWVFQGNPKIFDVVKALRDRNVTTWTVTAHEKEIKKGDKIILWVTGKNAGCYALGTVMSNIYNDYTDENQKQYYFKEENTKRDKCKVALDYVFVDTPITAESIKNNPILKNLNVGLRGVNFSATKEQFDELLMIASNQSRISDQTNTNPIYTVEDLSQNTRMDIKELKRWIRAVERKKQVIIYGPPGTGKTHLAEHLSRYLISGTDGFSEIVQFHPAYAYEDFIQGIRPRARENGQIDFTMIEGRFIQFSYKAKDRKGTCVLIIDEINRANLARVFGELMYLLEYRDRSIPLAAGGTFQIPDNVRIIGTMNTADRSIALVDHALRRRFAFLALYPNYDILRRYHQQSAFNVEPLINLLEKLNRQIADCHYEVGISFFLRNDLADQIEDIWRLEIEPYLEEYFFDQPDKVETYRWDKVSKEMEL